MSDRLRIENELPWRGQKVVLQEPTAEEELAAANLVGNTPDSRFSAQVLLSNAQVFYAMHSVDGVPFDRSTSTPEELRNRFTAREWQLILELFAQLSRPTPEQVLKFRETARTGIANDRAPREEGS